MQSIINNSNVSINSGFYFSRPLNEKILLVQVLVGIFLYVNFIMIFTFLKKEVFREDTRYILFAQTLFNDSLLMLLTDLAVVWSYYSYLIPMIPCCILCTLMNWLNDCTPLTLVAMCLERYVAICMPLRHADISNSRNRKIGLLIIWTISSLMPLLTLIGFIAVNPSSTMQSSVVCSIEIMLTFTWQSQLRAVHLQLYFICMFVIIVFTYIKIMMAARAASSDNKKSTYKSLRTVLLHACQLFLCLVQFLTQYIEMVVMQIDFMLFINVRYSNFIVFVIAPRCLSPLIYGIRDEKFFLVLKDHALFGLPKIISGAFHVNQHGLKCVKTRPLQMLHT
ncbi:odorant receptor 131-2-like [Chanos chanos]|uniref:Odorant receptor 131-2-like n=1 Tax=Chanos chanos TaxID=29144 RepID=A0A6J2VRZ1_CHACN|nr:odorant receptor 131-2-like [Chanos chanos]